MSNSCLHITKLFCEFNEYARDDCQQDQTDNHPQCNAAIPEKRAALFLYLDLAIDSVRPAVVNRIVDIDVLIMPSVDRIMNKDCISFLILLMPSVLIDCVYPQFRSNAVACAA